MLNQKCCKLWVYVILVELQIFQSFFKHCFCLLKYYLLHKFQQNWTIFGAVRAQKPLKNLVQNGPHKQKKVTDLLAFCPASQKSMSVLYGFWKRCDAQHYLLILVEKWCEVLDKWDYVEILLTDISKAFDWIDHELLIAKLHAYGFSLESLKFIQKYLSKLIQRVKINFSYSDYCNVELGVPQESISGPVFLNVFICDLSFDDIDIDLAN